MKTIKLFAALCCALVCALMFSSCEKQTTATYDVGLLDFATADISKMEATHNALVDYLASKGCPELDTWTIMDASLEKCDQQAKAKFENMVKNLSRKEIEEKVGLPNFTYGCRRLKPEPATIGEWVYPAE